MADFAQALTTMLVVLAAIFLPGSAILALSGDRRWTGLQQLFVATGLGLAIYPILFYLTRALLPQLALGRWLLAGLLLLALLITLWGIWRGRLFRSRLERLEWVALAVLGLTLASRFWFAYDYPFPAWSDSLHHVLLTDLTAAAGRLPDSLEPYFPNALDLYHLGLYAVSGTVQMLSEAPAHTALLWTAQVLNGLCGIGIYLVLDRQVGRAGALLGLTVAGLFSAHPALWANWGRFTQLSSVVMLPIAWAFFLELALPKDVAGGPAGAGRDQIWPVIFAAASGAAVFLFHLRVGIFYLLLIGATTAVIALKYRRRQRLLPAFRAMLVTGLGMLLLILPALLPAAAAYLDTRAASSGGSLTAADRDQLLNNFFRFPLSAIPYLVAPVWLLVVGGLAGLIGLVTRQVLSLAVLLWSLLMIIAGNLYLLNIPALNFTNLGAVLIMLYVPLSVMIGAALEEVLNRLPARRLGLATAALLVIVLGGGSWAGYQRAKTVELERHFVTPADRVALAWIADNIPADAVFAINTYDWLPGSIHGTDAGYWIPYFTGRDIVTTSMLGDGLPREYRRLARARSEAAVALKSDLGALDTLRDLGVDYIYIGLQGGFLEPGLQRDFLAQSGRVQVLYDQAGAAVLRILPAGSG
jgi:hypothetical protein